MNKKILEHIEKNKKFSLRGLERTKEKYKDYKKQETKKFFIEYKEDIKKYLNNKLYAIILNELSYRENELNWIGLFKKPLTKSMINLLCTKLNYITREQNIYFINDLTYLNKNTTRVYSILLYIRNYNKINKIMSNVLKEFLRDYDKKLILENI